MSAAAAAAANKVWVAASVGLVEALKDQGFARWNYPIRQLHQRFKSNIPSFSHPKFFSTSSSSPAAISKGLVSIQEKALQSEDSLRQVMFISSWAPN